VLLRRDLEILGLDTALKLALLLNFGFWGVSPGSLIAFWNKSLMLALATWAGRRSKSDSCSEGEGGMTTRGVVAEFRAGVSNRLSRARRRCVVSFDCVLLSGGGKDAESNLEAPVDGMFPDSSSEV
jgi:hypothetical protein